MRSRTRTRREFAGRSAPETPAGKEESMPKTLGIKLADDLHARLVILAQLEGVPLTEILQRAITRFADQVGDSPEFAQKAQEMLEAFDREAADRKQAIQSLLGKKPNG